MWRRVIESDKFCGACGNSLEVKKAEAGAPVEEIHTTTNYSDDELLAGFVGVGKKILFG